MTKCHIKFKRSSHETHISDEMKEESKWQQQNKRKQHKNKIAENEFPFQPLYLCVSFELAFSMKKLLRYATYIPLYEYANI